MAAPPLPGHRSAARHRGRGLGIAVAIIAAICLAGLGYKLLHHQSAAVTQPPAPHGSPTAALASSPATTVQDYFRAINHHRYGRAWLLGGKNTGLSYAAFVSGFRGTARDAVGIISTSGDVVTARLTATQADGSVKTYEGTYTVIGGQIARSDIRRIS